MLQQLLNIYCSGDISKIPSDYYCATRDVFRARYDKWFITESKRIGIEKAAQLLTIIGEVGNNSYDHNLGHWQNSPGLCFYFKQEYILLYDQGRGIEESLSSAGHSFSSSAQYLDAALTQRITGRAPERRGNGLKVSLNMVNALKIDFYIRSKQDSYQTSHFNKDLSFGLEKCNNPGVLVLIDCGSLK